MTKLLFLLATVAIMSSISAHAWTATAIGDGVSQTIYDASTQDGAEAEAMFSCNRVTVGCRLAGETVRATAVIVASGVGGWVRVSDPDPDLAAKKAFSRCLKTSTQCFFTSAVWDHGNTWASVTTIDTAFFTSHGYSTRKEAVDAAMRQCNKQSVKPETCVVQDELTTSDHGYFSVAVGKDHSELAFRAVREDSHATALLNCNAKSLDGVLCKIDDDFSFENAGPTAEPTSMKKFVEASRDGQLLGMRF